MEHFGGYEWSRKRLRRGTSPRVEDWAVLWRGWTVGRVMEVAPGFYRAGDWYWAVQTNPASSGHADTLEEALERVREGVSFAPDGLPTVPGAHEVRRRRRGGGSSPDGERGPR